MWARAAFLHFINHWKLNKRTDPIFVCVFFGGFFRLSHLSRCLVRTATRSAVRARCVERAKAKPFRRPAATLRVIVSGERKKTNGRAWARNALRARRAARHRGAAVRFFWSVSNPRNELEEEEKNTKTRLFQISTMPSVSSRQHVHCSVSHFHWFLFSIFFFPFLFSCSVTICIRKKERKKKQLKMKKEHRCSGGGGSRRAGEAEASNQVTLLPTGGGGDSLSGVCVCAGLLYMWGPWGQKARILPRSGGGSGGGSFCLPAADGSQRGRFQKMSPTQAFLFFLCPRRVRFPKPVPTFSSSGRRSGGLWYIYFCNPQEAV